MFKLCCVAVLACVREANMSARAVKEEFNRVNSDI